MNIASAIAVWLCVTPCVVAQWANAPPATADPSTAKTCLYWAVARLDDIKACKTFASDLNVSWSDFQTWNPAVKDDCSGIIAGNAYCIGNGTQNAGPATVTSRPSPLQQGQPENCSRWYFVNKGDTCNKVTQGTGVSFQQLLDWNRSIGNDCSGLWANVYVCVGVPGAAPPPTSTHAPGNSIATPSPLQGGQPINCNRWYLVRQADTCDKIAVAFGVPAARLIEWNTSVGKDCSGMWANVYLCIMTADFKPTPTPTSNSGGIATPSPTQPGQPNNCQEWYFVQKGDTCQVVMDKYRLTMRQIQALNKSIGDLCDGLWANVYLCVRAEVPGKTRRWIG